MRHGDYRSILAAALLSATPVPAAMLLVPSGYPTIQVAVDSAAAGDTVLVAPGTYTDWEIRYVSSSVPRAACVYLKDAVVLLSEQGAQVTIIDMLLVATRSLPPAPPPAAAGAGS